MAEESIYSVNLELDESLEKLEAIVDETAYLKHNQIELRHETERQQELEHSITKQIYERKKAYEELRMIQSSELIGAIHGNLPRDEIKNLREYQSIQLAGANAEIQKLEAKKQSFELDRGFARAEESIAKKNRDNELKEESRKAGEEREKERKLKDAERHEAEQQRKRLAFEREVKSHLNYGYDIIKKMASLGWGGVKLAGATAIGGGLVGLGYGALATDANNALFESQKYGGGTTAGELKAARSVYGNRQIVENTDQLMTTLQTKLDNITERTVFLKALLGRDVAFNESPADILPEVINAIKTKGSALRKTDPNFWMNEARLRVEGLGGFDTAMIRRLSDVNKQGKDRVSYAELKQYASEFAVSKQRNAIADIDLKNYQKTVRTFSETEDQIITSFQKNLVALNQPIQKLSESVGVAVNSLLSSKRIESAVTFATAKLMKLGNYLASEQLEADFNEFMDDMDILGGAIYSAAEKVGKFANLLGFTDERSLKSSEYKTIREIGKDYPELAKQIREAEENPSDTKLHNQAFATYAKLTDAERHYILESAKGMFQDIFEGGLELNARDLPSDKRHSLGKSVYKYFGSDSTERDVRKFYGLPEDYTNAEREIFDTRTKKAKDTDGLIKAIQKTESSGSPLAISATSSAIGTMQTTVAALKDMGVNLPKHIEDKITSSEWRQQHVKKGRSNDTEINQYLQEHERELTNAGKKYFYRIREKSKSDREALEKYYLGEGEYHRTGGTEASKAYAGKILKDYGKATELNTKAGARGAGTEEYGTYALAKQFAEINPDFREVTAFKDSSHKSGYHPKGLAGDIALKLSTRRFEDLTKEDFIKSDRAVADLERLAKEADVKINILNEVRDRSEHATAPHIHYSFPNKEEAKKFEDFATISQQKKPSEIEKTNEIKSVEPVKVKADINAKAKITVNNLTGMGINTVQGLA